MPSWEDNFNDHELWSKIRALQDQLAEGEAPESSASQDTLAYMISATELVVTRKDETPALQVTTSMLVNTAEAVDNLSTYLSGWREEAYSDSQVDTQTEALIQSLAVWPPLSATQAVEAQEAASERITQAAIKAIASITTKRDEMAQQLSAVATEQEALTTTVAEQTALISTAIGEFKTESRDEVAAAVKVWDETRTAQSSTADEHVETLRGLEKEAREMVHATTGSTVASDYGKYARNKTWAAWICDVAAALIGSVGVAAIIYHLYQAESGADGDVGLSVTRLGASLGTLGIAALVAHRGREHHKEARAAKRTDLAIRRVGPFMANLPDDAREEIIVRVTERIFIKQELDDPSLGEAFEQSSLWDRIKAKREEDTTA